MLLLLVVVWISCCDFSVKSRRFKWRRSERSSAIKRHREKIRKAKTSQIKTWRRWINKWMNHFLEKKAWKHVTLCHILLRMRNKWTALKNTAVSYKLMTTYRTFVIVQLNNGRHNWRVTLTRSNFNMFFLVFQCCQLKKHAQKSEDTLRKIDKEYQDSCRNAEVARLDWEGTVSKVRKKLVSALWFQLVVAVFLRLIMSCF